MTTLTSLDPSTLLVDSNIRADLRLDADFLASIKTRGVLAPIVAVQTTEGVRVRAGHRRTAAAVAAGLLEVPVVIVASTDEADRIVDQLAENDHRTAITATERVAAVQQLALLGVSAAQIVKRTRIRREDVDGALVLAERTDSADLLDHAQGNLTVAGWLAEFDGDDAAQERIRRAFSWRGEADARHQVELIRQAAVDADRLARAGEQIADEYGALTALSRSALGHGREVETLAVLGLDETDHAGCPGHVLVVEEAYLPEACDHGDHDEDEACWQDDPDRVYATVDAVAFTATAYCRDWITAGHPHPYRTAASGTHRTAEGASGTDAVEARADAARAERRRVIGGNKAWAASHSVRAEFIDHLAARKSAIPGAAVFALDALQDSRDLIARYGDRIETAGLTGTQATNSLAVWIIRSRHAEAASTAGKGLWRSPSPAVARMLRFLQSLGYGLSAAEEAAAEGTAFALPEQD